MPTKVPTRTFVILDHNTISDATRDRQEEKRPKKRTRVEADDEDASTSRVKVPSVPETVAEPVNGRLPHYSRDPVYYKLELEADTHILITPFMFRIDGNKLDCCPTMFDEWKRHGATSESNPLIFTGITVEEFRAFVWAIHASMSDLATSPHEPEYLERLARIASITTRYNMPRLREWALRFLDNLVADTVFLSSCSSACLTHLVDTTIRCNDETGKLKALVDNWVRRIENKDTPCAPAIIAADLFNLTDLRGTAYYFHLQDMVEGLTSSSRGAVMLRADPKLNNGQVMRLLAGYLSLVSLWERHRMSPIPLPKAKGGACTDATHARCKTTWEKRWTSAAGWKRILGINSADALALFACLRDQLMNDDDLKAGMNPDCRLAGLEALRELRSNIKTDMADHFFGVV